MLISILACSLAFIYGTGTQIAIFKNQASCYVRVKFNARESRRDKDTLDSDNLLSHCFHELYLLLVQGPEVPWRRRVLRV